MDRATRRQLLGVVPLAAVALVAAAVSPERALALLDGLAARPAAFALALCLVYLCRSLVAWPIGLVSALVGFVYGPAGLPIALVGAVLTTLPPYALARRYRPTAGPLAWTSARSADLFETTGDARGVLAARLAPVPTDVVSAAAGLARVDLRAYVLGTAVGEVPWVVASVLAGSSMDALSAQGAHVGWPLVVAGVAAAAALMAGPMYRLAAGTPPLAD
ncbi:TVP38/TMEM64 family protein [Halomarina halobia]|uniref:TVP38/TMEM64 family protein n=1 Tax=Halomarina halobia TaxID=3033386 RepID=A0ABD6A9K6_9EURY|nr:VTT domain-containing protein [Halomarina sp. PSR21]